MENPSQTPEIAPETSESQLLGHLLVQSESNAQTQEQLLGHILSATAENGDTTEKLLSHSLETQGEMLKELRKPDVQEISIKGISVITLKGENGKDGKTPTKGTDYFTPEEIEKMAKEIQDKIKIPEDGKTPIKGIDYFTEDEIYAIIEQILQRIPKPKDGEDGEDAEVDYEKIITEVVSKIPKPKDGKDGIEITTEELIAKLKKQFSFNDLKDAPEFKPKIAGTGYLREITDVEILQEPADGQALVWSAAKKKWIPSTPSAVGGYVVEVPSGTVDGSNTVFTVSVAPVYIVSDGVTLFEGVGYSRVGLTLTLNVPPQEYIRSFHQ